MNSPTTGYSIIIPVFNRAHKLARAIASVRSAAAGSPLPLEIVVVDDASQDNSAEVAARLRVDRLVRLRTNLGVTGAKNEGIKNSTKDWLVFLDSDDLLPAGVFRIIGSILEEYPEIDILFGACSSLSGRMLVSRNMIAGFRSFRELLHEGTPGEFLPICNRRIFGSLRYMDELRGFEGVTWLEAAKRGYRLFYSNEILRLYDDTGTDRLCAPQNMIRGADRLARGFHHFVNRFGSDMAMISSLTYLRSALRFHFYGKCARIHHPIMATRLSLGLWCIIAEMAIAAIMSPLPEGFLREVWRSRL